MLRAKPLEKRKNADMKGLNTKTKTMYKLKPKSALLAEYFANNHFA